MSDIFGDALTAGAVLTGFCGTFLSFRIQREAEYHRKPSDSEDASNPSSLSHFSPSFLILLLASVVTMIFGTVLPLLGLIHVATNWITLKLITAEFFAGLTLIGGYFAVELVHYDIRLNKLENDKAEWRRELPIIFGTVIVATAFFVITFEVF